MDRTIKAASSRNAEDTQVKRDPLALKAPGFLQLALEARAPFELWASILGFPILKQVQKGDGQPVVVFPGLAAGDLSTFPMRRFFDHLGYPSYGWEQGLNAGPRDGVLAACRQRIVDIHAKHGRPVSLVGWSLGGLYAREMAKLLPGRVRQVITLGSPFAGNARATHAWRLFEMLSGHHANDPQLQKRLRTAPNVPTTSIFSKSDGVVAWQCSVQSGGKQTENIEVLASHFGIGMNPCSLFALADRLAQPEGRWQPFQRSGMRSMFYGDGQL